MEERHVEYSGLVYKDTAVDVMYDLADDRLAGLDHQVNRKADLITAAAKSEIKLMQELTTNAQSLKECTRYGAEKLTEHIKKSSWDKILLNHQLLLQLIESSDALCKERAEWQSIIGRCSLACSVADDDGYDGEDE